MNNFWLISLACFTVFQTSLSLNYSDCKDLSPLGMRNGFIQTSQLSVSSSYGDSYTKACGRLNSRFSWCSNKKNKPLEEYYQVDFKEVTFVNGIGLQGDPKGNDYVAKFKLKYKVREADDWTEFEQGKVFNGNTNSADVVYRWFSRTLIARIVRLIPVSIKYGYVCLRIELYGCSNRGKGLLYPIGMESKIISDQQLQSNGENTQLARLYTDGYGLCHSHWRDKLYLTIDFQKKMYVTAIAIQSALEGNNGVVSTYKVEFIDLSGKFKLLDTTFPGNVDIGTNPVLSVLPQPVTTEKFKIVAETYSSNYHCMKFEVYGKVAECNGVLSDFSSSPPSSRNTSHLPHNAYIDSPISWCPNAQRERISLSFGHPVAVTGISLQGDSQSDSWVKSYSVEFTDTEGGVESYTNLKGVSSRIDPVSVQWFSRYLLVKQIALIPKDDDHQNCLRFNVHGCKQFLSKPRDVHLYQLDNKLTFTWKPPDIALFKNTQYKISITATKDYDLSFSRLINLTLLNVEESSTEIFIDFGAANLEVRIDAFIQNYFKGTTTNFTINPITPDAPQINSNETFNGKSMQTNINFTMVSNIKGPISGYQVIFSLIALDESMLKNLSLYDQTKSQANSLPYFLWKYINQAAIMTDSYNLPPIIEGEKDIPGYGISLSTTGTFFMYIRAIILQKDIESLGYGNQTYYGNASRLVIQRQSLLRPRNADVSNAGIAKIYLVQELPIIQYCEIIVMQINKTTLQLRPPSSYISDLLKRYGDAKVNEPYITAVLNASAAKTMEYFTIGDDSVFDRNTNRNTTRLKRAIVSYRNGKLNHGVPYIYFQRAIDAQGTEYSSPWSEEFQVSEFTIPVTKETQQSSFPTGTVVGIVIGLILALIICILVFFVWKRRRDFKKTLSGDVHSMSVLSTNMEDESNAYSVVVNNIYNAVVDKENHYDEVDKNLKKKAETVEDTNYGSYYNLRTNPKYSPIPANEFPGYYLKNKNSANSKLVEEFKSVPLNQVHSCDVALQHKDRNRYKNIIAYDHTRVILKPLKGNEKNDYINANHVQSYTGKDMYIASQAPTDHTIYDFWQMILNQTPSSIIMLTNFEEKGKKKCSSYWSDKKAVLYNGITVRVLDKEIFADYTIRKMSINFGQMTHVLQHFHFTSWPDHGCPEYPTMLLSFIYRFRHIVPYEDRKPVVVHCSAGVGRTGTLIIIDAMLDLLKRKNTVDIYNYYEAIRQSRYQMVQTVDQYQFIYSAMYEVITCGTTGINTTSFATTTQKLLTEKNNNGEYLLEEEFQRLNSVTPVLSEEYFTKGMLLENVSKNRNTEILPRDSNVIKTSSYINAVYVDGYKIRNGFIATEAPLFDTIEYFWNAVLESDVSTIVMLYDLDECPSNFPIFWPVDCKVSKFGGITVRLIDDTKSDCLVQKKCSVQSKKMKSVITLLHLQNWPDHDIPTTASVLSLVEEVLKSQQSLGNKRIMVLCSDGANRSGTFIACMNTIEQLKVEQHVDIFQNVRRIRLIRPQFVENQRQYQFIYTVVLSYLDSFSTYSNFS